jgi:hypothetical protein
MINIADLPAVRAQLERATATAEEAPGPGVEPVEYARAPEASGPQVAGNRPPATQGASR